MPDQQSEVNLLEVMAQIFKSAGQYLSLVCDWADLPDYCWAVSPPPRPWLIAQIAACVRLLTLSLRMTALR